ncbi:MAG: hypothetical protein NC293_13885 [Roseburia sp.]|nr:hypothetical protein [Roseburia sp.]
MKKNLKRTLAKVMAVALTVALAGTATPEADAAKKIKLSSKSITVTKGKSKKVTIKNVKKNKVKKLTVKSNKTKIATAKASGKTALKVTGKKAGSAKITVSVTVKGKKKATKLTLKVKVKNASAPTPSTAVPTSAATTPPTTSNGPTGPANPTTSNGPTGPASPTTSDGPSVESPDVSGTPTTPGGTTQFNPVINITDAVSTWAAGGSYGTVTKNDDGSVTFNSKPSVPPTNGKEGSVYNNGISWYLSADKAKTDVSAYKYVKLIIKTDAEIKLMTWAGGSDPDSFWDKKDCWGAATDTVNNADGSKCVYYPVETVFAKTDKATAVGLTLKSWNGEGGEKGADDDTNFGAMEGIIYGVEFCNEVADPVEIPDGPDNPSTETPSLEIWSGTLTTAFDSDATVTPVKDENDDTKIVCYQVNFTGNQKRIFIEIPEGKSLKDYASIEVTANVPAQMTLSVFGPDFNKTADKWWEEALGTDSYPFWKGTNGEVKTEVRDISNLNVQGTGGYISLSTNGVPDDDWENVKYLIYSVKLIEKVEAEE